MTDIFNKETQFGSGDFVTSDRMILKVSGVGPIQPEYLVQSFSFSYNQPLNRIYEIGSALTFFAPGRSVGSIQLSRIVGKYPIVKVLGNTKQGLWVTSGNVNQHVLQFFKKGASSSYALAYVFSGAVISGYQGGTDANGLLFSESCTIEYASLDFGNPSDAT